MGVIIDKIMELYLIGEFTEEELNDNNELYEESNINMLA